MRGRILAKAPGPVALIPPGDPAFLVDGHYWHFNETETIFVRAPKGSLRRDQQYAPNDPELHFVRRVIKSKSRTAKLPIERGDETTIGRIPVDTEALDQVEALHGVLAWTLFEEWMLGRTTTGEVVAIWKMPKDHAAHEAVVVEVDGKLWLYTSFFAMRINVPDAEAAMMRKGLAGPPMTDHVIKTLAALAAGQVVPVEVRGEHTMIGETKIPTAQRAVVEATVGKDLEWLYTGPRDPVGARNPAGEIVAFVAPIVPREPPKEGKTDSPDHNLN